MTTTPLTARLGQLAERATRALTPSQPTRPALHMRPGIYLGWGAGGPVHAAPEHHALILGPPRSGKTSRIVTPAILCHPGPAVVTSTKPDVLAATLAHRQRLGRCWYWDPSGTTQPPAGTTPLAWSPLHGCDHWDSAVARAHALAGAARPNHHPGEAHWMERAQALLAPLLHAAALDHQPLDQVLTWLQRRQLLDPAAIVDHHHSNRAGDILAGIAATDPREQSGIYSTADSILAAYRTDAAVAAARHPNFDPAALPASGDTIYLVAPGHTQDLHRPLVVALLEQLRTHTYQRHPNPPVLFALDELANIAPLPALPALLAEGGSQGLTVLATLQDLTQARTRWPTAADGLLTLFSYKIILGGIADTTTLQAISTLAGHIDRPTRSTTTTRTGVIPRHNTTWTTTRQPRLPPDTITHQPPGTAILLTGTHLSGINLPPIDTN